MLGGVVGWYRCARSDLSLSVVKWQVRYAEKTMASMGECAVLGESVFGPECQVSAQPL